MALPSSGNPISLNQVNVELGLSGTTTISMNQTSVRNLFGIASGTIRMSDGHGKSAYTPAALTRGYNGAYGSNDSDFYGYTDKIDTNNVWETWNFIEYVSGAAPITVELKQYRGGGSCSSILVESATYGTSGTNLTNQYVSLGNGSCADDVYNGSGGCKKSGYFYVVISNPYSTIKLGSWILEYGYMQEQCGCNCGTTYVCETCDYDCSADCATGYGAVCDCDPSADDWCEPNCPCGQSWCNSYYECNCPEDCQDVHQDVYYPCGYGWCSTCSINSLS
jgi:hypothetical protein